MLVSFEPLCRDSMDPSEHGEVPESLRQGEPCGCQVLSWQRHSVLWADGYKAIKSGHNGTDSRRGLQLQGGDGVTGEVMQISDAKFRKRVVPRVLK